MKNRVTPSVTLPLLAASALLLAGCGSDDDGEAAPAQSAFALSFAAVDGDQPVGCTDQMSGLGTTGDVKVGVSDLRFYVSNIRFYTEAGDPVEMELDENEFQYVSDSGSVVLIDLTGNTEGSCTSSSVAFAEGTARTNSAITGLTFPEKVSSVVFDVGVPQQLMKEVIAVNTEESAPSPLNEMYWNWASGYRHFVLNAAVEASDGNGDAYVHVGSRDCGPMGGSALSDRDSCSFVNTPGVGLGDFNLDSSVVTIDVRKVFEGQDFRVPILDSETKEVIGEGPGVACHSMPSQTDCAAIFPKLGLSLDTGVADSKLNTVFGMK
ncbi:MAG: metallo-mystery pair system four-Cys motif protein [Polyangiaceae bacterium]|nr:metallo-mystery pair system four-Cys motif protein [Myxococcales bacterium]MCB9589886.1 metallo-mystery pair system four-Cys motif protein [Polyangiaceae bacterium]